MHPAEIKAALEMRGVSQLDIAKQLRGAKRRHISATAVSLVIHGRSRSQRIENRIAAVIAKPPHEIWPQWHGPNAKQRKRPMRVADARRQMASGAGAP